MKSANETALEKPCLKWQDCSLLWTGKSSYEWISIKHQSYYWQALCQMDLEMLYQLCNGSKSNLSIVAFQNIHEMQQLTFDVNQAEFICSFVFCGRRNEMGKILRNVQKSGMDYIQCAKKSIYFFAIKIFFLYRMRHK